MTWDRVRESSNGRETFIKGNEHVIAGSAEMHREAAHKQASRGEMSFLGETLPVCVSETLLWIHASPARPPRLMGPLEYSDGPRDRDCSVYVVLKIEH